MLYEKDSKISRPLFASAYIWHSCFLVNKPVNFLRLNFLTAIII